MLITSTPQSDLESVSVWGHAGQEPRINENTNVRSLNRVLGQGLGVLDEGRHE